MLATSLYRKTQQVIITDTEWDSVLWPKLFLPEAHCDAEPWGWLRPAWVRKTKLSERDKHREPISEEECNDKNLFNVGKGMAGEGIMTMFCWLERISTSWEEKSESNPTQEPRYMRGDSWCQQVSALNLGQTSKGAIATQCPNAGNNPWASDSELECLYLWNQWGQESDQTGNCNPKGLISHLNITAVAQGWAWTHLSELLFLAVWYLDTELILSGPCNPSGAVDNWMHVSRGSFCSWGRVDIGVICWRKKKTPIIETCCSTTKSEFHTGRVLELIVNRISCLHPLPSFLWVFLFISVTWKNPLDISAINYCHMFWVHYQRNKS